MKMKSKSTQNKSTTVEKPKTGNNYDFLEFNKPFDFVGLYKTAAETDKILEKYKTDDTSNKDNSKNKVGTPKREHSPYKNKKRSKQEPVDLAQINIDASSFSSGNGARARLNNSKVTSTPNGSINQAGRVKSIMKNTSTSESMDSPRSTGSGGKPKKRNKSVSFMLDENEEVVIKRTKSDDSIKVTNKEENTKANVKDKKKPFKKVRKDQQSEKENKAGDVNKQNMDVDSTPTHETKPTKVPKPKKVSTSEQAATTSSTSESPIREKKKKLKKVKKQKPDSKSETMETESNNNEVTPEIKTKKLKKKKQSKHTIINDKGESGDGDDEPVPKSRKKNPKPDIAEDLENLSIGDNAHTLTNMLDEMTVVDKDKQKKLRQKFNKNKRPKGPEKEETEKPEEVKEKVKWKKRKWNKDRKGELDAEGLATTVIVENLPIAIMLEYKKLLIDHFVKYGLIKKIGIAEVYPTEVSQPVFTTTINFSTEAAAELALGENNSEFEGSRIRIRRPLPATATTVVVRSYAELTDQNISTTFLGIGKIRSIKHLVKGKKSMATCFIEFDGPEAVERAITTMADAKIGGKKMHVAKFEPRLKKKKEKKPKNDDSAADADSEDSND